MATATRKIGLSLGADLCWPKCFEDIIRRWNPELRVGGETIRFDDVRFGYGNEPVLRGIDLEIRAGEIVALVGPSGAGKTSLVNLLPRFFDPTSGSIKIDGRDLRDITLESLRSQIGIVTQETMLFNDSIRNNIAYGSDGSYFIVH